MKPLNKTLIYNKSKCENELPCAPETCSPVKQCATYSWIEVLLQTRVRESLSAGYQHLWFLDNFYQQVISILI